MRYRERPRPHRPGAAGQAGFTLIELLGVLALLAIATAISVPPVLDWNGALRVRMAASELLGALHMTRLYAVRHQANVGAKFRTDPRGEVSWTLYRDGNGNGVRSVDIAVGRDPQVHAPRRLAHFGRLVRFGFPPGMVPRDPGSGRPMTRLDDPIRFNNSDLASFSPLGTSTPGSLYLTDGRRHLVAVRLNGRAGKTRVLVYDPVAEVWNRD